MTPQELVSALYRAFEYTNDNNRDLVADGSFPLADAAEELVVQYAFQYLIAYIVRNERMIAQNLSD
jgi:hypothetical protein